MRFLIIFAFAFTLVANASSAQGSFTGSQTYIGSFPALSSGAHELSSASYKAISAIDRSLAGPSSNGTSYGAASGALTAFASTIADPNPTPPPIITLVTPSQGGFDANEVVSIYGRYFDADGIINVDVSFGGIPADSFDIDSDSLITATTPFGGDDLTNPNTLGQVDVTVTTTFGSETHCSGYTFLPAIFINKKSQAPTQETLTLDPTVEIEIVPAPSQSPPDFVIVGISGFDVQNPPPAVSVPPYGGSIVLDLSSLILPKPILPSPTGQFFVNYDLVASLNLLGVTLAIQAIPVVDFGTSGQLTNLIVFIFE